MENTYIAYRNAELRKCQQRCILALQEVFNVLVDFQGIGHLHQYHKALIVSVEAFNWARALNASSNFQILGIRKLSLDILMQDFAQLCEKTEIAAKNVPNFVSRRDGRVIAVSEFFAKNIKIQLNEHFVGLMGIFPGFKIPLTEDLVLFDIEKHWG